MWLEEKYNLLSHKMVTVDVDLNVWTAYCKSSSCEEVNWGHVTYMLLCSAVIKWNSKAGICASFGSVYPGKRGNWKLYLNSINKDNGIEIPQAWMPMIKKHNNRRAILWCTIEGNWSERCTWITIVQFHPVTAEHNSM